MAEEFIYDRQRIFLIIFVLAVIISAGLIIAAAWPKSSPVINDVQTNFSVLRDTDLISDRYTEFFNGSIDTTKTILYKIDVFAEDFYFMGRMSFTLQVDGNITIIGVVFTNFYNEELILYGQNDVPAITKTYIRTIVADAGRYSIYVFLNILVGDYSIDYNVRVSD